MAQSKSVFATETCPLLQCLIQSNLDHLYMKLKENEIMTIVELTKLNENELTTFCHKLQLNDIDTLKLKELHQNLNNPIISTPIKQTKSTKNPGNTLSQLDDMQHILEAYFTEIESGCNSAKNKIDEKFQEIIISVITKQKKLHQQINEWKLNKLENVNREISDIIRYKNEKNTNNTDKFKKYQKPSDLIKHIQSITPIISVNFDCEMQDNIKHAISSLIKITNTNFVSFPTIILSKPNVFMDKNNGYCIKLNWLFKHYNKDINKDNIILKYKAVKQEKDLDDEKMNKEWRIFKHGTISLVSGENEDIIHMKTQLIDVMKLNELYVCQIEYLMKETMDIIIQSNMEQFINIKHAFNQRLNKIKLEYYLHRKHSLTRHPKYLLLNSDTKQYWSSLNNDFETDECDWIIFKYKDTEINKKWIPKKIIFKNYKSNQDIRTMMVYIGDVKSKEWYALTNNPIQPKLSKELQYFDVDNFDVKLAQDEKCIFIKLEFVQNYGENNPDMCRFCCRHFALMGVN